MAKFASYTSVTHDLVSVLPSLQSLETKSVEFWKKLEVDAAAVLTSTAEKGSLDKGLNLGVYGTGFLALWTSLDTSQATTDPKALLTKQILANLGDPTYQTVVFLNEFVYGRRLDSIETISRLILPQDRFNLVSSISMDNYSKKFLYALFAYVNNPHHLQLLMLFERAERAGYTRCALVPVEEHDGIPYDDETIQQARKHIQEGADTASLDVGKINDMLKLFESQHGSRDSLCFEVFPDKTVGATLVFVFRYLRHSLIREVDDIVFGDEAELIVLRLYDRMHIVDVHSSSGIGASVAASIAGSLLNETHVRYVDLGHLTDADRLQTLIESLVNDGDQALRFQELYLEHAPFNGSPKLILRCDKTQCLSVPIQDMRQRNIDLLGSLENVRSFKMAFIPPCLLKTNVANSYIFNVTCSRTQPGRYLLGYAAANILIAIRTQFEQHLKEQYGVQVVPGGSQG